MALIRGVGSDYPCPRCLVPKDSLTDLAKTWDLQTTETMADAYDSAQELNAKDGNAFLQKYGLRDVEVWH